MATRAPIESTMRSSVGPKPEKPQPEDADRVSGQERFGAEDQISSRAPPARPRDASIRSTPVHQTAASSSPDRRHDRGSSRSADAAAAGRARACRRGCRRTSSDLRKHGTSNKAPGAAGAAANARPAPIIATSPRAVRRSDVTQDGMRSASQMRTRFSAAASRLVCSRTCVAAGRAARSSTVVAIDMTLRDPRGVPFLLVNAQDEGKPAQWL